MGDSQQIFVGLDAGTSGVRCVCVRTDGTVVAQCISEWKEDVSSCVGGVLHEQNPDAWWVAASSVLREATCCMRDSGISLDSIGAIAVDGTSGTLACLDREGKCLRPAIMYNDGRSTRQAEELNRAGRDTCDALGYQFSASFALPKALWIRSEEPEVFERTRFFVHQADYLAGRLTGCFDITDYNNALKTGYDVRNGRWPEWTADWDGLGERLPQVVAPGDPAGFVSGGASAMTGLPTGVQVVAGTTDGIAGFLASGARDRGDCNTTLGTTLVFKAVSGETAKDERGAVYSHKLSNDKWLPGAASNTGAAWIPAWHPDREPAELDAAAGHCLPADSIAYPLVGTGERFPFLNGAATGFLSPEVSGVDAYAARLQGTAFVERLAYDELSRCTGREIARVFCTGGGSRSRIWMQLRSDVCGIPFLRPAMPEAAFGAAVLAAAGALGSLDVAMDEMVRMDASFEADPVPNGRYCQLFSAFLEELEERGYK